MSDVDGWVARYGDAWRAADSAAAAALFSRDASYSSDLFGPGLRGRAEVAGCWIRATADERSGEARPAARVTDRSRRPGGSRVACLVRACRRARRARGLPGAA